MRALKITVGKRAKQRIIANGGLSPDMVRIVLGASGGPKWLVLRGLDGYIFGDWLLKSKTPLDLLGTSIGCWRMTLAATKNPAKAFALFEDLYFSQIFDKNDNTDIWTESSYDIARHLVADGRADEIANNNMRRLNAIAVRAHGMAGAQGNKYLNVLGMTKAAILNLLSRNTLGSTFDRVLFSVPQSQLPLAPLDGFNRIDAPISHDNIADIMMASGSIPGIWNEICDIKGAPHGAYRDGGVTDYHFGMDWQLDDGVVLYPHFYSHMTPGWFDKKLPSRTVRGAGWDDMIMLSPTEEFVATLPSGRLTDRTDFAAYSNEERLDVWRKVVDAGYDMAEEFKQVVQNSDLLFDRMQDAPS